MLLEGRKQPRHSERFLLQISAVLDPLRTSMASVENLSPRGARVATEQFWEPGSHVEIESRVRELTARARVVYCQPGSVPNTFAVGLNFLITNGSDARSAVSALVCRYKSRLTTALIFIVGLVLAFFWLLNRWVA
jgi:PilZ domain-containing protein